MSIRIGPRFPTKFVWDDFKAYVRNKYGTEHGSIGETLQEAVILIMARDGYKDYPERAKIYDHGVYPSEKTGVHTHKIKKCTQKVNIVEGQLCQKLSTLEDGATISYEYLANLMRKEGTINRRTHKDHVDALVVLGMIEPINGIDYDEYLVLRGKESNITVKNNKLSYTITGKIKGSCPENVETNTP